MRIRTIKPEFHQNEKLASCSREVRLLAAALLNIADDEGYFRRHPALIAGALFPFDTDGQAFVAAGLMELQRIGYVEHFEEGVARVVHFKEHQVINKPTKSKLREKAVTPSPTTQTSRRATGELPESSESLPHGSGTGNREVEQGEGDRASRDSLPETNSEPLPSPRKRRSRPPDVELSPEHQAVAVELGAIYERLLQAPYVFADRDRAAVQAMCVTARSHGEVGARWEIALRKRDRWPKVLTLPELRQHWNQFPVTPAEPS